MTKEAALRAFFGSFGLPAYPDTAVPPGAAFPYVSYEPLVSAFGDGPVALTANLWYFTGRESLPGAKARQIAEALGPGGRVLPCDGGYIWLRRGSPWCRSLTEGDDPALKRRLLNLTAEFLTEN